MGHPLSGIVTAYVLILYSLFYKFNLLSLFLSFCFFLLFHFFPNSFVFALYSMYLIVFLLNYFLQKGHFSIPIVESLAAHMVLSLHLLISLYKFRPLSLELCNHKRSDFFWISPNKAFLHCCTLQSLLQCLVFLLQSVDIDQMLYFPCGALLLQQQLIFFM